MFSDKQGLLETVKKCTSQLVVYAYDGDIMDGNIHIVENKIENLLFASRTKSICTD